MIPTNYALHLLASLWLMDLYGKPDPPGSGFFTKAARN